MKNKCLRCKKQISKTRDACKNCVDEVIKGDKKE